MKKHLNNKEIYYEFVDADGDYDDNLHITSTIDGSGLTVPLTDFRRTVTSEVIEEILKMLDEVSNSKTSYDHVAVDQAWAFTNKVKRMLKDLNK